MSTILVRLDSPNRQAAVTVGSAVAPSKIDMIINETTARAQETQCYISALAVVQIKLTSYANILGLDFFIFFYKVRGRFVNNLAFIYDVDIVCDIKGHR